MCQLLSAKSVATKESLLQPPLEEFHYICKVHVEICVHIGMCYLFTFHIIDAYSSTTKKNARPSGRGHVHRRARRGERAKEIVIFFSLATSLPKGSHIYIYTLCFFSSFLFPGDLHACLDILWQPLRKSDNLCGFFSNTITAGIWT